LEIENLPDAPAPEEGTADDADDRRGESRKKIRKFGKERNGSEITFLLPSPLQGERTG